MRSEPEKDTLVDDADAQLMDRLADLVDQASDVEDDRARASAIETVAESISAAAAAAPNAYLYYLIGYAWYLHPQRMTSEAIQEKVDSALRSACSWTLIMHGPGCFWGIKPLTCVNSKRRATIIGEST